MIELDDSDMAAIAEILGHKPIASTPLELYRAGIAAGLERACKEIGDTPCYSPAQGRMYLSLVERIRALTGGA